MLRRTIFVLGSAVAVAVGCTAAGEEGIGTGESMAVTDIAKMTLRPDGKYDVECRGKDGGANWKEVASQADVTSNKVCSVSPVGWLTSAQARADGSFDVGCTNGVGTSWVEVRTATELQANAVCLAPPPAPVGSCPNGMCPIPAGTFQMGSTNGVPDEQPVHAVTLAAYELDEFEVTVSQYAACVTAGGCTAAGTDTYCNAGVSGWDNHPINCVDWNQATAYCTWDGKRLPTEQEWEYAARGTDGRKYPWGNEEPDNQLCWSGGGTNRYSTCEVGSYPSGKSPFGVQDMEGNVGEWASSLFTPNYSSQPIGTARVFRGRSWSSGLAALYAGSSFRDYDASSFQHSELGFRCARSK
jgi:formylglycine-generating enzyme required for sulfatase activity